MRKILAIFSIVCSLSSCSYLHVHRMDIEQGNIITPDMVSRVHTGMTKGEVKEIMGEPILANIFDDNRLVYVYSFKPGYGPTIQKNVTFFFRDDHVSAIKAGIY